MDRPGGAPFPNGNRNFGSARRTTSPRGWAIAQVARRSRPDLKPSPKQKTLRERRAMIPAILSPRFADGRYLRSLFKISLRALGPARGPLPFGVAIILFLLLCVEVKAQILAPTWQQQSPSTSPTARYIHAITYDAGHGQVVLFGGFGGGGDLNDTWLWNGTTWAQVSPANSPSSRSAHAMVYDAAHGQVVLFGGLVGAGTRLGDTWLWDGPTGPRQTLRTVLPRVTAR